MAPREIAIANNAANTLRVALIGSLLLGRNDFVGAYDANFHTDLADCKADSGPGEEVLKTNECPYIFLTMFVERTKCRHTFSTRGQTAVNTKAETSLTFHEAAWQPQVSSTGSGQALRLRCASLKMT